MNATSTTESSKRPPSYCFCDNRFTRRNPCEPQILSKITQSEAFRPREPKLPLRNVRRGADPIRAYDCRASMCATAIIVSGVFSGAEARYWRHYAYHWYGRSWSGSRPNGNERRVENQLPRAQQGNEPRNRGDFGGAIEEMIHACDEQVQELRNMPLDSVAEMVKPTEQQRDALEQIRAATRNASETLHPHVPKICRLVSPNV
jgi:hypothetical protein